MYKKVIKIKQLNKKNKLNIKIIRKIEYKKNI